MILGLSNKDEDLKPIELMKNNLKFKDDIVIVRSMQIQICHGGLMKPKALPSKISL